MHPSGHLRPDSSLVATQDPRQVSFSISRVSPRLASPGSDSSLSLFFCSSLVLYGILFFSSYGPLEVVRQRLLFLSFSRPSSFSLSNLREIQKHFGWPAEIVPPDSNSSLRLVRLRVKKRFVGARLDTGSISTSRNHVSFSQHPTFVYAPPNWRP